MQSGRDSSLLRDLAVAFGDGLAFGVGMKLSRNRVRHSPTAIPEITPVRERIERLEQRLKAIERAQEPVCPAFDPAALEAVVDSLEARLNDYSTQVERRFAEMQSRLKLDLLALEEKNNTMVRSVAGDIAALRSEMVAAHREFVQNVSRTLVGEVSFQVDTRVTRLEDALGARLAVAFERAVEAHVSSRLDALVAAQVNTRIEEAVAAQVTSRVEAAVAAGMAPVRAELADAGRRIGDTDATLLDFILGMGQMCRQIAERVNSAEAPAPPARAPSPPPAIAFPSVSGSHEAAADRLPEAGETRPDVDIAGHNAPAMPASASQIAERVEPVRPSEAAENQVPELGTLKPPSGRWRVPLVSSFIFTMGGIGMMHLLRSL
jgi:hypothetical protein